MTVKVEYTFRGIRQSTKEVATIGGEKVIIPSTEAYNYKKVIEYDTMEEAKADSEHRMFNDFYCVEAKTL